MEDLKFIDKEKELHGCSGDAEIILELMDERQWVLFNLTRRQAKELGQWLIKNSEK